MAESQSAFDYNAAHVGALHRALSKQRLNPYRRGAGFNEQYAFELYLYNARLSKAFLFPLHVAEVSLRNHIDQVFSRHFTADWPTNPGFQQFLLPEGFKSLQKSIARFPGAGRRDDIIANVSFELWSNLFRAEYTGPGNLRTLIFNAFVQKPGFDETDSQNLVRDVNLLRNRVAHYEPIFHFDLFGRFAEIRDLIALIDPNVARWMVAHATVNTAVATKPTHGRYAPIVKDRADGNFKVADWNMPLDRLLQDFEDGVPGVICTDAQQRQCFVITPDILVAFLRQKSAEQDGLLLFSDYAVRDVVGQSPPNFIDVDEAEYLIQLASKLSVTTSAAIVSRSNAANRTVVGLINRAHRRY